MLVGALFCDMITGGFNCAAHEPTYCRFGVLWEKFDAHHSAETCSLLLFFKMMLWRRCSNGSRRISELIWTRFRSRSWTWTPIVKLLWRPTSTLRLKSGLGKILSPSLNLSFDLYYWWQLATSRWFPHVWQKHNYGISYLWAYFNGWNVITLQEHVFVQMKYEKIMVSWSGCLVGGCKLNITTCCFIEISECGEWLVFCA